MSTPSQIAWRKLRSNRMALAGMGYIALCILMAIFAYPLATDQTPHANDQVLSLRKLPPGTCTQVLRLPQGTEDKGNWLTGWPRRDKPLALAQGTTIEEQGEYLAYTLYSGEKTQRKRSEFGKEIIVEKQCFTLGSDGYGRDLFSRLLLGARVSLAVGALSVLLSLAIGLTLGLAAGYLGGWVDRVVMWFLSVMWSLPTLLLALALSFVLGRGFWQLFVAIGLSMWVEPARMVRGEALAMRKRPFAEAAEALGFSKWRIMWKHVLPNVVSPLIIVAVTNFGTAVLIESGLSFLGIGVEPPVPSWGRMIFEGYQFIMFENGQWLAIFPGIALIFLVVSINLVGIGLRDALASK